MDILLKSAYRLVIIGLVYFHPGYGANIIEEAGGGSLEIAEQKSYLRAVTRYYLSGDQPVSDSARLNCRFYRYGPPEADLPLLVIFIEWGGTIESSESRCRYENALNDPFITLVIMPESVDGQVINSGNWYWGNTWADGTGNMYSIPWCHTAVVELLNDLKYTALMDSVFPGATVDTSRIYGFGHSIGGTATHQVCVKHPEIFAAYNAHAGWTRYWGPDNMFFSDSRGCLVFSELIGGIDLTDSISGRHCVRDSSMMVEGNADQLYLGTTGAYYHAFDYTDLGWYFGRTGAAWHYRDPAFPTPFIFFTVGDADDPNDQGDNLQPALELSRRGYQYYRASGGHAAGGVFVRWHWLRNFRKDQSYLAFTSRDYGLNDFTGTGYFNPLDRHGWDPATIKDSAESYEVTLTGTGIADVTLRRLQNLKHRPGSEYTLRINGADNGTVTADEYGLITIPQVADSAHIRLECINCPAGISGDGRRYGTKHPVMQIPGVATRTELRDVLGAGMAVYSIEGRRYIKVAGMSPGVYMVRAGNRANLVRIIILP